MENVVARELGNEWIARAGDRADVIGRDRGVLPHGLERLVPDGAPAEVVDVDGNAAICAVIDSAILLLEPVRDRNTLGVRARRWPVHPMTAIAEVREYVSSDNGKWARRQWRYELNGLELSFETERDADGDETDFASELARLVGWSWR